MTTKYHVRTTGNSDAVFNRKPQTEGQRLNMYGKLEPALRQKGELTWWQGAALLIFIALAGLGLTLAFGS